MKTIKFLKDNDIDVDAGIELLGDEEVYTSMLEEFKRNFPKKIEDIEKSYEAADMPNYAIFVHSLKSDSKYFGFTKLAELASNHEEQAKANNILFVRNNYNALMSEINEIKNTINSYFSEEEEEPIYEELESLDEEDLPIKKEENTEEAKTESTEEKPAPEVVEAPEALYHDDIILIADDSDIIRAFVKKLFDIPYELVFAGNGEEAIEVIKEHENDDKIGAILLDLNMPKIDGFGVLDYLKEHGLVDKMPVTIVSGEQDANAVKKVFDYQIVDMLNKPFNEEKIKVAIEKTIASKK